MKKRIHPVFEPAKTKEQKKKRIRNIIITAVILVAVSIACYFAMPKNKQLAESYVFNEEQVKALAEQTVTYINEENYDALKKMSVEKMASIMNKERMDEAKKRVSEDWGEFRSVRDITTTEVTQRGVTAAVAYVTAEYENTELHFTFAFDEDMKLASLGMQ